jgi:hypothetical protein
VGNDNACFFVINEEFGEMLDARLIKVIGRLVEKKEVGLLDKGGREKKPGLLSAGKRFYHSVVGRVQIDDFKRLVDKRVDVVCFFGKAFFKKFADRGAHFVSGNGLARGSDAYSFFDAYFSRFRPQFAGDKPEYGAFARAVLAHESRLPFVAERKINLIQDGPVVPEIKGHLVESQYDFVVCHGYLPGQRIIMLKKQHGVNDMPLLTTDINCNMMR